MVPLPHQESVRLSFFYAAFFAFIGVVLPFWPVWLASKGLDVIEIGIVMAVGMSVKIVSNPFFAHIADRRGERKRVVIGCSMAALASFSLFGAAQGFWPLLGVSVLFFGFWPPTMPLTESLTMLAASRRKLDYGRIRLWGSLAFIASSVLAGRMLVDHPESIIFSIALVLVGFAVASALMLPDIRAPKAKGGRLVLIEVLGDKKFLLFLATAALLQPAHGVYYGFGTLNWQRAGLGEDVIGGLWAIGVTAEIVLFIFSAFVVRKIGPIRLLALAGLAGTVRWTVIGATDALPALILVQVLHAFTFGAAHLGAIHFIARAVSPALSATAQGLYAALVMGLGMGLSMAMSGYLYAQFEGRAFFAMSAMSLGGFFLALTLGKVSRQT